MQNPLGNADFNPTLTSELPPPPAPETPPSPELNFDWPVRTKGGKPVTIVSTNMRGSHPIAGYIGDETVLMFWDRTGFPKHYSYRNDLEQVPATTEVFVIFFADRNAIVINDGRSAKRIVRDAEDTDSKVISVIGLNVEAVEGRFDIEL